jgi:hypothetical protein
VRSAAGVLLAAALGAGAGACKGTTLARPPPATHGVPAPEVEALAVPPPPDPAHETLDAVALVRLRGDARARGAAFGRAFRAEWREALDRLEDEAVRVVRKEVEILPRWLARVAVRGAVDLVGGSVAGAASGPDPLARLEPRDREYLIGIADGAGVTPGRLLRVVALVLLSDASCSGLVAFGPATEDGRLLQTRNLDWGSDELGAERGTVLLVHEPPGGQRWLSIGFVGLVGSVSGINESGISLTEIGASSRDRAWRGTPMPLLLERVLADARTLDEAVALLASVPTTGGYNFLVGSARERRGAVVERTARRAAVFEVLAAGPDPYAENPWFEALPGFDCRADTAADPAIRALQKCSRGEGGTPAGSGAYERRYRAQVEAFRDLGRPLDLEALEAINRAVAPRSNLHSVIYDFERHRVRLRIRATRADGRLPATEEESFALRAAAQSPLEIDLRRLFR